MLDRGVNPRDIPALAKPPGPGGLRAIDAADLKVGDTFVDVNGEPRRVVNVEGDKIETADGTAKTYHGEVNAIGELNSPKAQLARGGKFISPTGEEFLLKNVPDRLTAKLQPDEAQNLSKRPATQKNFVKAYGEIEPTANEIKNAIRAGHGLGGWWQRFMDSFEALGRTTDAKAIRDLGFDHAEALKAFHGALSGNKLVSQANRIAWGAYRDWLEAGRPTDARSISRIVKNNRGISGIGNLDTNQLVKLVNSPQFQEGAPFHGQAWVESPVPGKAGAKKIPSMVGTTAGKGNLARVVLDTHMLHLYGLNDMSDAQYLAMSVHMREVAESIGLAGGEGQEQAWGTIIALKKLMKEGMTPAQAAQAFTKDVVASIGKDYAQTILDSMNDPEVKQAMDDLKKFGFDPGGPVASRSLREIAEEGAQRMRERARPGISERLLSKSATRIQETMEERARRKAAARLRRGGG